MLGDDAVRLFLDPDHPTHLRDGGLLRGILAGGPPMSETSKLRPGLDLLLEDDAHTASADVQRPPFEDLR